jgi:hypothetical protein
MLAACAVIIGVLAGATQPASAFVPCPTTRTANRSIGAETWNTYWGTSRETAKGVTLCQVQGNFLNLGYLEIADLQDGAKIRLQAQDDRTVPHGTRDPITPYIKRTAQGWYEWIRGLRATPENLPWLTPGKERLFSVTNATFFKDSVNGHETALPFPFEFDFSHDTYGKAFLEAYPAYPRSEWRREAPRANYDYDAPKSVLQLNSEMRPEFAQSVRIRGFRERYLPSDVDYWYSAPHAEDSFIPRDSAVSFRPEFDLGGEGSAHRRTYVGVWGLHVYIFVTNESYSNAQVNSAMQEIQPGMDVIQMDGGGSTQFYSAYGELRSIAGPFAETRDVPTVLAIYRGP